MSRHSRTILLLAFVWTVSVLHMPVRAQGVTAKPCPRCGWTPPATVAVQRVHSVSELYGAVGNARAATTILLADGEYRLDRMLDVQTPGVVIRGASGDPSKVVLRGAAMTERQVGVALSISAPNITIADLTIGYVGFHGIQVRGERGASLVMIHNVRIVDTGQQLIKGSTDGGALHADEGVVACSTLEYGDHAPGNYTNGVDVIGGNNWVVRDNTIRRIRGVAAEGWASGPAILFWGNSRGTKVERNVIIDSFRGIAFGLGPGASGRLARDHEAFYDHQGGWIRNNVVVNLNSWADEGIEANAAGTVAIDHNTVLTEGTLSWGISARFPGTIVFARNNLMSKPLTRRDGGQASVGGNVPTAASDWFVDAAHGNVALNGTNLTAVDAGVPLTDVSEDASRQPRTQGKAPDAGAFEYRGHR
jgi:hypothetical protein